jgi:hypothetical protein
MVVDLVIVALVPDVLEPGTVIYEMHHVAWSGGAGAEVGLVREILPEPS